MARSIFLILISLLFQSSALFSLEESFRGWIHLELGAGNYCPRGDAKNRDQLISDVIASEEGKLLPKGPYGVLLWTLEELVKRYGDKGVFQVNDIHKECALYATEKLVHYAMSRGYNSIIFETVVGDFHTTIFPEWIKKYGKLKYDSIHLKNPEIYFYRFRRDHNLPTEESRRITRQLLKTLSGYSQNGLIFFTLYDNMFIPQEEKMEFIDKNLFYLPTEEWETVPYISPYGYALDKIRGRVFLISP